MGRRRTDGSGAAAHGAAVPQARAPKEVATGVAGPGEGPPEAGSKAAVPEARNEVLLVGRLSADPEERELPSGDRLVALRLVVGRPASPNAAQRRAPTVDTIDCSAWTAGARRSARALRSGDVVLVEGSLRRRFWRAGAGVASRCEVEAVRVVRVSRPA